MQINCISFLELVLKFCLIPKAAHTQGPPKYSPDYD